MRPLVSLALLASLAACATDPVAATAPADPTAPATTVPAAPSQDLASITHADLQAAIATAKQAGPAGAQIVQCFSYLDANLNTLQGNIGNLAAPVGVFSAFANAHLALAGVNTATSSTAKMALENACGPLGMDVRTNALTFGATLAGLLAQVGIKVALPGLP